MFVETLTREEWATLLRGAEHATPFHLPEWADYRLATIPGATETSLLFRFDDGLKAACPMVSVPRFIGRAACWSMPHDEYGGILSVGGLAESASAEIYQYLLRRCRPVRLATAPKRNITAAFEPARPWRIHAKSTHILEIPGSFEDWLSVKADKDCRWSIRRAASMGLTINRSKAPAAIDDYYALYRLTFERWERKSATPHSRIHFAQILASPISRLYTVYQGERPAAGMITLESPRHVMYYLGASDSDFSKCRPVEYGISEIIRDAIAAGRETMNFGASLGSESLQRFKEKFGACSVPYAVHDAPDSVALVSETFRYYKDRIVREYSGLLRRQSGTLSTTRART